MNKFSSTLLKLSALFILSGSIFAEQGEDAATRAAIEAEFSRVDYIGEIIYRDMPAGQGCDIMANVLVTGDLHSGTSNYECDLCLLDAGNGFFDFDRDTIFCSRERH